MTPEKFIKYEQNFLPKDYSLSWNIEDFTFDVIKDKQVIADLTIDGYIRRHKFLDDDEFNIIQRISEQIQVLNIQY